MTPGVWFYSIQPRLQFLSPCQQRYETKLVRPSPDLKTSTHHQVKASSTFLVLW
jgi:hypothetical protein